MPVARRVRFREHPVLALTLIGLVLVVVGQPPAGGDFFTVAGSRLVMIGGVLAILPVSAAYALRLVFESPLVQMAAGTIIGLAVAIGLDALLRRRVLRRARAA